MCRTVSDVHRSMNAMAPVQRLLDARHLLCTWPIALIFDEPQKNEIYFLSIRFNFIKDRDFAKIFLSGKNQTFLKISSIISHVIYDVAYA